MMINAVQMETRQTRIPSRREITPPVRHAGVCVSAAGANQGDDALFIPVTQ